MLKEHFFKKKNKMIIKDEVTGIWYPLKEGSLKIGRTVEEGHYQIPFYSDLPEDKSQKNREEDLREKIHFYSLVVSRDHGIITYDGKRIRYQDNSKRGTFYNEERIFPNTQIELHPGNLLILGGRKILKNLQDLVPDKNKKSQLDAIGYPIRIINGSANITD
jgi:hypothetical protein